MFNEHDVMILYTIRPSDIYPIYHAQRKVPEVLIRKQRLACVLGYHDPCRFVGQRSSDSYLSITLNRCINRTISSSCNQTVYLCYQGKWGTSSELGQNTCIRFTNHEHASTRPSEGSRSYRHPPSPTSRSTEERWTECRNCNGKLDSWE